MILGPFKIYPPPIEPIASVDSTSGELMLDMSDLTCESKGGYVGEEELQCWEGSNNSNPKIMNFKGVKKLSGGNGRRLTESSIKDVPGNKRRLQSPSFQFNCILSEVDMTEEQSILINYERCKIGSNTITIGHTQANGVGVTTYSASLVEATVILPIPIQDILTTEIRDCDARWTLDGYTNILINGNEVRSGCKIIADGSSAADSTITVDFGQNSCTAGHSVSLGEGSIVIDGIEIIAFGTNFKNIVIALSNCDDEVSVASKLYSDTSSVEILGYGGNDNIELGDGSEPLEAILFGNIIIDGGEGEDVLNINDSISSALKSVEVRSTVLNGLHADNSNTISYFGFENVDVMLGSSNANVTVLSTARGALLNLTTQNTDDSFTAANGKSARVLRYCSSKRLLPHFNQLTLGCS